MSLRRGAQRTHGDRGPWLATSDLLALWPDRKPDIEYIAQYSGARPSAIRERLSELITGGGDLAGWGARLSEVAEALSTAVRHQSIENAPLLIFATVGAVLFLFMVRT